MRRFRMLEIALPKNSSKKKRDGRRVQAWLTDLESQAVEAMLKQLDVTESQFVKVAIISLFHAYGTGIVSSCVHDSLGATVWKEIIEQMPEVAQAEDAKRKEVWDKSYAGRKGPSSD